LTPSACSAAGAAATMAAPPIPRISAQRMPSAMVRPTELSEWRAKAAATVGAILTAVGSSVEVTQTDAERRAGTIGVSTAIVLLVILALAYYAGGYVAGRMSRFDGARQGLGVWIFGLVVTIIAIALGAIFGEKYNVLERVDLPRIPISTDDLSWGAVIAGVAVVLVTLVFAILGGVVGHRYHNRVDRAVRH